MLPASAVQRGTITLPYRISTNRLLLLTLLSNGIYLYYWFWLTWRHYRDHTGERVFPGWHTIALGIPIYGLFHVHEHITAYNRLMSQPVSQPGLPAPINAWLLVALMLAAYVLSVVAAFLSLSSAFPIGLLSEPGVTAVEATFMKIGFDSLNIIIAAGLLTYVQQKLNAYWEGLPNVQLTNVKLGWGEYVCVIIGVLDWTAAAMTITGVA